MTLEMAIRDWQQRLDEQAAEIERLRAERDAWRKMVLDHNEAMRQYENNYHRIDIPPELEPKP